MRADFTHPIAALLLALSASAAAQLGPPPQAPTPDKPLERPSPDMPQWLRDRQGVIQDAEAMGRKELFRVQDLLIAFIDPTNNAQFVRVREDGSKEATVRIEHRVNNTRRVFLLRAMCKNGTSYFGPVTQDAPPMKAPEAGSVGELLYKELCP